MTHPIRQSTSTTVLVGPVLDSAGNPVTAAVVTDFNLTKNGITTALATPNTATHSHNGFYLIPLTSGNTDTAGRMAFTVNNTSYQMSINKFTVYPQTYYDAQFTNALNSTGGLLAATAQVTEIKGALVDTTRLPANFSLLGIAGTGELSAAVTVTGVSIRTGLGLAAANLDTQLSGIQTSASAVESRITAARAGFLDYLNIGGPAASRADIDALNQSASRRVILQSVGQFERPESGTTLYTIEARTFDGDGAAANADTLPTLAATGQTSGSLTANLGNATNPATGVYRWSYSLSAGATTEPVRFDLSATIAGSQFPMSLYSQVTDLVSTTWTAADASRLTAIYNKLPTRGYLPGATDASGSLVPADIVAGLNSMTSWSVNIAGNLSGSVGSVTAAVSVTGVSIRSGLGLAAANLDTQLSEIQTSASAAANGVSGVSLRAGLGLSAANLDTQLSGIKSVTDKLNTGLESSGTVWRYTAGMLALTPTGSTGALSPAQDSKLTQLYEAVYPPVSTDPPLIITPSTPGTVTGYAVCYALSGAVQAGIQVQYRLQSGPTRDLGRIFRGATTGVATSGANGLVQFPGLVPGATYYFSCGNTEVSVTIPLTADPLHGYALPSFTAT